MKQTQYAQILAALRKAGKKGCTNHDLMLYSNCPWKRIAEATDWNSGVLSTVAYDGIGWGPTERIIRDTKKVNGRTVRVYRLEKV